MLEIPCLRYLNEQKEITRGKTDKNNPKDYKKQWLSTVGRRLN